MTENENVIEFPNKETLQQKYEPPVLQNINRLEDDDFDTIWGSDIDDVRKLKSHIEIKLDDYRRGLDYLIREFIEDGIEDMESPFFSSVMTCFIDNIEREFNPD